MPILSDMVLQQGKLLPLFAYPQQHVGSWYASPRKNLQSCDQLSTREATLPVLPRRKLCVW